MRLIQLTLPKDAETDELLQESHLIARWPDQDSEEHEVLQVLVHKQDVEPIMDAFTLRYQGLDRCRLVLLRVEACLPRLEEKEPPPEDLAQVEKEKKEAAERISREELYQGISSTVKRFRTHAVFVVLSAVVAAVGLMRNDIAILIGAMVIAPLLGPNVALALGVTLGDRNLIRKALLINAFGLTLTLGLSIIMGWIFPLDVLSPAVMSRTTLGVGDLILALVAGTAGTLAFTRGASETLIGVMVAVAMMPPAVTMGMLMGQQEWSLAGGALQLLSANVVCVILSGVATFAIQQVRPRTWWEGKRARNATRLAGGICIVLMAILVALILNSKASEIG